MLLLDTSGSMHGKPIAELNAGLRTFKEQLTGDLMAAQRVEVAVMTFGPVRVLSDFETADAFTAPDLAANGDTPMGAAIMQGLDMLETRKNVYKQAGIAYYRPWVFLITDGGPSGRPPGCKGFFEGSSGARCDCGHVSGLFVRQEAAGPVGFRQAAPNTFAAW